METGLGVDLAALVEGLSDAVIAADRSNRIVYANPAAVALLGWSHAELIGSALTALMPPRFRPHHRQAFARFFETGEPTIMGRPIRLQALHADSREIPIDLVLSAVTDADGQQLAVGVLRDVTDRVELEHHQAVAARFMDVLGEAPTLEAAGPPLLAAVGEELGWEVAGLWVVDANNRRLTPLATWHDPDREAPAFLAATERTTFAPGEGLPGRVWASGEPIWVTDVVDDPNFPRAAAAGAEGLHGACGLPVIGGGRVLGVIELFSRDARQPDEHLLDVMARIGAQLGELMQRQLGDEAVRASRQRLDLALDAGRMGTWEWDVQTGVLSWSSQVGELFGLPEGAGEAPLEEYLNVVHREDRDAVTEALRKAADEGEGRIDHRVTRPDGTVRWVGVVGRATRDAAGRRLLAGIAADITERKAHEDQREQLLDAQREAQRRLAFLAEASATLASSLDYRETLAGVTRLAVPSLGDWCRVYGRQEDGTIHQLAAATANPADQTLLDELYRLYPPDPEAPIGVARAIRTRRPEFHPEVTDELLARVARGPEHLALLSQLGLRSFIAVPLLVRDRVLGALTLGTLRSGRTYNGADLALAEELARRAAQAVDNALVYQERERVAQALQDSLLPPSLPDFPGIDVAARYRPAGRVQVGGDFYDLFPLRGESWAVIIGDVRGKGAAAAAVTGLARWTARSAAMRTKRPQRVLANLNETILSSQADEIEPRFCTLVFARLQPREEGVRFAVASGGHPLPLVLRASGTLEAVGGMGMLVGALPDAHFTTDSTILTSGDLVLFFTDGVLEARQDDRQLGEQGLRRLLTESAGLAPEALVARIMDTVDGMRPGARDDIALVALRVR